MKASMLALGCAVSWEVEQHVQQLVDSTGLPGKLEWISCAKQLLPKTQARSGYVREAFGHHSRYNPPDCECMAPL